MYFCKRKEQFSVSHCEIQKPQCGIYISQCGIQILHCETENSLRCCKECTLAAGISSAADL